MCSHSTKGIWIDILCFMWESPERGKVEGTVEQLSRMVSAPNGDFDRFLEEVLQTQFASIFLDDENVTKTSRVTGRSTKVTLINRRMFRDEKERKSHAERQDRYRKKHSDAKNDYNSDAKVTIPSSSSSSSSNKKEDILSGKPDHIPFSLIISYLNQKTKRNYSHKTDLYQRCIRARWNEGKREDDFQRVVDIKCSQWLTDENMVRYCRPETLFGSKMDSYLQEEVKRTKW